MTDRATLAAARYRLLLDQLREEYMAENGGKEHGWKAWAGRRLGVTGEYVGMVLGDREGAAPVEQAMSAMGLHQDYFYKPLDHEPKHTDYLATKVVREDAIEMTGVTAYFKRHPHHERFRAAVNRHLNASVGDVAPDLVKSIVRGLEDLEAQEAERQ